MKSKRKLTNSILSWGDYLKFFFLIGLVLSASFFLFFQFFDISFKDARLSALVTFLNWLFLTLFCTICYGVWKHFNINKPLKRILEATDKISKGDFNNKIEHIRNKEENYNEYDLIIENINKMSKELSSIETLRIDFISNVSHELKTPLAIIQNYASLLQSEDLDENEKKEYIKAISDSSKHLSDLITNILRLNKLENQDILPSLEKYNLSEQIVQCILNFETNLEEKNLEIQTDFDDVIEIHADKELMEIVWNNLISNAIKFSKENGKITISIKQDKQTIITISDKGIGMNEDTIRHMFEKFYQGDTSHAVKGNGLGLALTKRILDIHDAQIQVNSKIKVGTTLTIIL